MFHRYVYQMLHQRIEYLITCIKVTFAADEAKNDLSQSAKRQKLYMK